MSPPGREDLPVPTFNAEIFGLLQDVITTDKEMGKKAKVIVISPNTHDFESKLSDALEVEISEDSESESEDDDSEQDLSLQDRLDALKYDCNEWESKLLGGVVLPDDIKITFADIRVAPSTVQSLRTLTTLALIRPEEFTYGILSKEKILGVLLYGPPGTGKTLLAKAVAKESHATVLEVTGADVLQTWLGDGEKMVRAIFSLAKKLDPCIVFIDEADGIFRCREKDDKSYQRDLINQFLREWDGISGGMNDTSGFMMMATNRPSDLDPAVLRRLPRRILVDVPTRDDRQEILNIHLKGENLAEDCDINAIADMTTSFTGSDLKNLCVAAAFAAVYENVFGTSAMPLDSLIKEKKKGKKSNKEEGPRRTLHQRHFEKAMKEINSNVDPAAIAKIKQFGKMYREKAH